jgi:hypothetical protein
MLAVEKNQWIPRDNQVECEGWTEVVDLAVAVIKLAIKDDLEEGIDPMAYIYDERIINDPNYGDLWWNIISLSSRVDIADLKRTIVQEILDASKKEIEAEPDYYVINSAGFHQRIP